MSAPVPRQTQEPVIHSQSHLPEKITHLAPEKRQYSEAGSALYGDVNSLLNPEPPVAQQHTGGPPLPKRRATVASARTGQACDRCKNRKIRCDPNPDGCMPCRQNQTECKTTDRITGRASVRGHVDLMERDNAILRQHIAELQEQLRNVGVEPKPLQEYAPPLSTSRVERYSVEQHPSPSHLRQEEDTYAKQTSNDSAIATTNSPRTQVDTDIAFSPHIEGISAVKGLSMSLFGVEFNIGEFMTESTSERVRMMSSLESTLDAMFLVARSGEKPKADLPATYEECKSYAEWYLIAINGSYSTLHGPTFMSLIDRVYNHNYQSTIPETVMIHIMLAIMKFLYGTKIENKELADTVIVEALTHYHYSLTFWKDMLSSRTLKDTQALTMICVFVRWLAVPDNAWSITNTVFSLLIDRGYNHRPINPYDHSSSKEEILEQELRRRLFYCMLCLMVKLNGRLGRPMTIRREDYDVELPRLLNDDLEDAQPGPEPHQCNYYMILTMAQDAEISLEMYGRLFALHPTIDYEEGLTKLERKLESLRQGLPELLTGGAQAENAVVGLTQANTLWVQLLHHDCQIKLHHPALCRSRKPEVINRNLDICVESSRKVLELLVKIWENGTIDTTWAMITDTSAAAFTLLYALWERRDQTTLDDWSELKALTDQAIPVIGRNATMFGCGPGFLEKLQKIIDSALERIRRYYMEKTVAAAAAAAVDAELDSPKSAAVLAAETENVTTIGHDEAQHSTAPDREIHAARRLPALIHDQKSSCKFSSAPVQRFSVYNLTTYEEPATSQQHRSVYHHTPEPQSAYAILQQHPPDLPQFTANRETNYAHPYVPPLSWREWAEGARDHNVSKPEAYQPSASSIGALGIGCSDVVSSQQELHQAGYNLGLVRADVRSSDAVSSGMTAFVNLIPDNQLHSAMAEQSWAPSHGQVARSATLSARISRGQQQDEQQQQQQQ